MRRVSLLCLMLLVCGNLRGADEVDTTARFHDVPGLLAPQRGAKPASRPG